MRYKCYIVLLLAIVTAIGAEGESKSCFQQLGLTESSDARDIQRAYKQLSRKYHPDASSTQGYTIEHAKEQLELVQMAYTICKNLPRTDSTRGSTSQPVGPPGSNTIMGILLSFSILLIILLSSALRNVPKQVQLNSQKKTS